MRTNVAVHQDPQAGGFVEAASIRRSFVKVWPQRYVPSVTHADAILAPSVVYAQGPVASTAALVDDFDVVTSSAAQFVRNAPSPGAAASLPIGGHPAAFALERFASA